MAKWAAATAWSATAWARGTGAPSTSSRRQRGQKAAERNEAAVLARHPQPEGIEAVPHDITARSGAACPTGEEGA
ncbi:MAG: hypothetical protein ICV73_20600 [Acetobacteraceae bacterium]|nr:hypothetical protein [Acetobacteraceae bacterium]